MIPTWLSAQSHSSPTPPIPPVPGPLYFSTNDVGLTEYETDFDVAEPNVVLGISFAYTGTPTFTITHEGEPLDDVHTVLSLYGSWGVVTAVGKGLTVEVGKIRVEVSGGTIGPFFGGVNEIGFEPGTVHYVTYNQYLNNIDGSFPAVGKTFVIAATGWGTTYPSAEAPMEMRTFRKNIASADTYPVLGVTPSGLGWTYDAVENKWSHTIPNTTQSAPALIDGPTPFLDYPPMAWKCYDVQSDQDNPQLSTYFYDSVNTVSQNIRAYPTGDPDGSWVAATSSTTNVNSNYFRAVGNTSLKDPEVMVNHLFNCGGIASSTTNDVSDWNYGNNGYFPTAMIAVLIENADLP